MRKQFGSPEADKDLLVLKKKLESEKDSGAEMKFRSVGPAAINDRDIFSSTVEHSDVFVFPDEVVAEFIKNKKDPEKEKAKLAKYAAEITQFIIEGKDNMGDMSEAEVVAAYFKSKNIKGLGKLYAKFLKGKAPGANADSAVESVENQEIKTTVSPAENEALLEGFKENDAPAVEKKDTASRFNESVTDIKDRIFIELDNLEKIIQNAVKNKDGKRLDKIGDSLAKPFENSLLIKVKEITEKYKDITEDKYKSISEEIARANNEIKTKIKFLKGSIRDFFVNQKKEAIGLETKDSKTKSEDEFVADLAKITKREELLSYLADVKYVRIDKLYPINLGTVKDVLDGKIDMPDMKIRSLREKIQAILAQEKAQAVKKPPAKKKDRKKADISGNIEMQAEIDATQPRTYGKNIYANGSVPEDAQEAIQREKSMDEISRKMGAENENVDQKKDYQGEFYKKFTSENKKTEKNAEEANNNEAEKENSPEQEKTEEIGELVDEGKGFWDEIMNSQDIWEGYDNSQKEGASRIMLGVHLKKVIKMFELLKDEPESFIKELVEKIISKEV